RRSRCGFWPGHENQRSGNFNPRNSVAGVMEIKYSRKQIKIGLIIGSALVVLNVANLIIYRSEVSFSLAVGLFLVGVSVYKHYRPYAVVKDGYFKKDL